jgi:hypothetical protein
LESPWSLTPSVDRLSLEEYPLLDDPPPEVDPLYEPLLSSANDAQLLEEDVCEPSEEEDIGTAEDPSVEVPSADVYSPLISLDIEVVNIAVVGPGTLRMKQRVKVGEGMKKV